MKRTIKVEIEIDDKYVEEWNQNFLNYHINLYKSEENAKQILAENPLEKAIADEIEDYLENNQDGLLSCNTYV